MSVIIPAHNEERVIGRLLTALLAESGPGEFDVIVVANGCSDRTAEVAASYSGVRVAETPVASKSAALRLGDEAAAGFPRIYVDADVVLGTDSVRALRDTFADPGILAAVPVRHLPMDGVRWPVRWYYDVWQRLPGVENELFGRGVVAVSEAGFAQLPAWADVMSDDLLMSVSFKPAERAVVPAAVVEIRPPRTYPDLVRRRIRAMTGNARLAQTAVPGQRPPSRTSPRELLGMMAARPVLAPKILLFLGTAVISRLKARRAVRSGDQTWLRDESSRT